MLLTRRQFAGRVLAGTCCGTAVAAGPALAAGADEFQVLCGIRSTPAIETIGNIRAARPEAVRVIQWICEQIGVRPNFELRAADFERRNIAVAATHGTQRFVIYDDKWFAFEENRVSWYSVYILAHEIGHHIYGHTSGLRPDKRQGELDADRFGGWIVARLGGRLGQALAFMPYLSEKISETHPARNKRIEATREGWLAGRVRNPGRRASF